MLSLIRRKKQYKFSVCILYPVSILHFVPCLHFAPGLQFAVCNLFWPDWYYCFCSNEPQVRTEILELEKKNFSETFLAAMIDVWPVGWGAPEEKYDDRTIITLYLLPTILYGCLWCSSVWSQRVLKWTRYGSLIGVNISASRFKLHF